MEDVNERPTEIAVVAKPGGVGVDFETDQPVIMENTERGATVAQLVVLDPDLHEEMTVLLSSYVVAVGSMSCLSLTKVTALLSILSALSTPPLPPARPVLFLIFVYSMISADSQSRYFDYQMKIFSVLATIPVGFWPVDKYVIIRYINSSQQ